MESPSGACELLRLLRLLRCMAVRFGRIFGVLDAFALVFGTGGENGR